MSATIEDKGRAEFVNATTSIAELNTITVRESIVSVFPERPADATSSQTLALIEQGGTLDFWMDDKEDIYTHQDGQEI
jgi:hypothetical protein